MEAKRYFTAREAVSLTGFRSAHMLDYLARSRIVVPSRIAAPGRGRRRLYSFGDLVLLRALNRLLSRRIPVRKLREGLDTLRRKFPNLASEGVPAKFLITDGVNIYFDDSPMGILDLNNDGQLAFAFIIDMHSIKNEIDQQLEKISEQAA